LSTACAKIGTVDFYLVMLSRWARPMARSPQSRPGVEGFSTG
jgi:hypothetical protein